MKDAKSIITCTNEELTSVIISTDEGPVVGIARLKEEDKDVASVYQGGYIAELKAKRSYHKLKERQCKRMIKQAERMIAIMKVTCTSKKGLRMAENELHKLYTSLEQQTKMINAITSKIQKRNELYDKSADLYREHRK